MSAVVAYMVMKNRRVKAAKQRTEAQGGRASAPSQHSVKVLCLFICENKPVCHDADMPRRRSAQTSQHSPIDSPTLQQRVRSMRYAWLHLCSSSSLRDGLTRHVPGIPQQVHAYVRQRATQYRRGRISIAHEARASAKN